jgi:hypothetical protein
MKSQQIRVSNMILHVGFNFHEDTSKNKKQNGGHLLTLHSSVGIVANSDPPENFVHRV